MTYEHVDRLGAAYTRLEDHLEAHYSKLKGLVVGRLSFLRYGNRMRLCLAEAARPLLDCGIADRASIQLVEVQAFLAECKRAQKALEEEVAVRATELEEFVRKL